MLHSSTDRTASTGRRPRTTSVSRRATRLCALLAVSVGLLFGGAATVAEPARAQSLSIGSPHAGPTAFCDSSYCYYGPYRSFNGYYTSITSYYTYTHAWQYIGIIDCYTHTFMTSCYWR